MSENSSKQKRNWLLAFVRALLLTVWVIIAFFIASFVMVGALYIFGKLGISLSGFNPAVTRLVQAAILYILTFVIILVVSKYIARSNVTRKDIGLQRLPEWFDVLLGPLAFIPYSIATGLAAYLATQYLPGFDPGQAQDIGFTAMSNRTGHVLAFITLVIIAPIAEESIFRGYLYQKVKKMTNVLVAILLVSLSFAFIHGQLNVGLDVFILSVFLCLLREATGSIWAGILLHMTKNAIAFYFLFMTSMF